MDQKLITPLVSRTCGDPRRLQDEALASEMTPPKYRNRCRRKGNEVIETSDKSSPTDGTEILAPLGEMMGNGVDSNVSHDPSPGHRLSRLATKPSAPSTIVGSSKSVMSLQPNREGTDNDPLKNTALFIKRWEKAAKNSPRVPVKRQGVPSPELYNQLDHHRLQRFEMRRPRLMLRAFQINTTPRRPYFESVWTNPNLADLYPSVVAILTLNFSLGLLVHAKYLKNA